jgi:hypothetical protein
VVAVGREQHPRREGRREDRAVIRGLVAFLGDFGASDLAAPPQERWLRAVAHAFLGAVAGCAVGVAPALWPWLLAAWAAVQVRQWRRDGWSRAGLGDLACDTAWTLAGVWLGAITAPRVPAVWAWSVVALAAALVAYGARLWRPAR